ncbi:hypothetical protein AMYX_38290 [Anaeromyxobacter diazotrophicus]|uniref:Uncharacterized protein n=1 Tax=Anaeromyxobacter diazotrophicus TaxID=2590199 RepID=A0A7I9VS97_9BACT|nr:hypothetical protein AMYX_38290 [Anaeromyxobacter diazotrophicus]
MIAVLALLAFGAHWAFRPRSAGAPAPVPAIAPAAPQERLSPPRKSPPVARGPLVAMLRAPGSTSAQRPGGSPGAAGAEPDRCPRTARHRPEPVHVDGAGTAPAAGDSTTPEAVERYLAQRSLQRQPKYRLAAASTALWLFRELRAQLAADLRTEDLDRRRGMAGPSRRAELLEELQHVDEAAAAVRTEIADSGRAPLGCEDPLVQKAALCAGYRQLGAIPAGSPAEAIDRFCSSDELRALAGLVRLGDRVPHWEVAPRALVRLAYELDRAYLVARSAEACLASRHLAYVEEKLSEAPLPQRAAADAFLYAIRDSRAELAQSGLEPLRCDAPEVQGVIRCVVNARVLGPLDPRCHAPELKVLLARVRRG